MEKINENMAKICLACNQEIADAIEIDHLSTTVDIISVYRYVTGIEEEQQVSFTNSLFTSYKFEYFYFDRCTEIRACARIVLFNCWRPINSN